MTIKQTAALTRYMLWRGLELRSIAPSRRAAWRTVLLAVLMPAKGQLPIARRWTMPVRIDGLGAVRVRDHSEMLVIHEVLIGKAYELDAVDPAPRLIVDLGANVGVTLLEFHRRFPATRVVGYEAASDTWALALRNIAGVANVEVRHAAVVAHEGEYTVRTVPGESWAASVELVVEQPVAPARDTVPGVTLDGIIDELGTIDLLKIDIEGAEYAVLRACRLLDRVQAIVGEYHRESGVTAQAFLELLGEFDVKVRDLDAAHGRTQFSAIRRKASQS